MLAGSPPTAPVHDDDEVRCARTTPPMCPNRVVPVARLPAHPLLAPGDADAGSAATTPDRISTAAAVSAARCPSLDARPVARGVWKPIMLPPEISIGSARPRLHGELSREELPGPRPMPQDFRHGGRLSTRSVTRRGDRIAPGQEVPFRAHFLARFTCARGQFVRAGFRTAPAQSMTRSPSRT